MIPYSIFSKYCPFNSSDIAESKIFLLRILHFFACSFWEYAKSAYEENAEKNLAVFS